MKPASIILGAFAALATAAPTEKVERGFDFNSINNFGFNNLDLNYLSVVNGLDFNILAQLANVNNLNLLQFGGVFNNDVFDLANILQFQQVAMLVQLAQLGVFNSFDLSSLAFNNLNFGLINNLSGFQFNSLIDQSLIPQITQVVQTGAGVPQPRPESIVTAEQEAAQNGGASLPA